MKKSNLKAFILSLFLTLICLMGPIALVINCFIFIDSLWLWLTLLILILIIGILVCKYFYKLFKTNNLPEKGRH